VELCVIEADGIGREVIPQAVRVLRAVAPDVNIHPAPAGWEYFEQHGTPLPEETVNLARECGAVLFGAAASPHYPVPGYYNPTVRLRRLLQVYANLRPTRYYPVPTARPGVDLLVVRENTEDLYVQHEQTSADQETVTAEKVITRAASERVARMAFDLAIRSGRSKVTIVHKANVMPQSDGLFRRVALEVSEYYPEILADELLVDTAAYWMVKDPLRFDVVLTPNLYGDILSDMAAAWGGGLGLAPSLGLGAGVAIAEPVHGSARDITGKGIANPTASILSVALLLRYHWHMADTASRVEEAVRAALKAGHHTADINAEGALSTEAFADKVLEYL
jgi:homoisocitrate dehydrogenase